MVKYVLTFLAEKLHIYSNNSAFPLTIYLISPLKGPLDTISCLSKKTSIIILAYFYFRGPPLLINPYFTLLSSSWLTLFYI